MEINITVKRSRASVTQGAATVYVNGIEVVQFGDKIELVKEGEPYYGESIGGWASKTPDTAFIIGALYHSLDNVYRYSESVKKSLRDALEQEKAQAKITEGAEMEKEILESIEKPINDECEKTSYCECKFAHTCPYLKDETDDDRIRRNRHGETERRSG